MKLNSTSASEADKPSCSERPAEVLPVSEVRTQRIALEQRLVDWTSESKSGYSVSGK